MMKHQDFLYQLTGHKELQIVGPLAQNLLLRPIPTLYVDGGTVWKKDQGFSVGDNDSYSGNLDMVLPREKDFTDLHFALNLIPSEIEIIHFQGFLGGDKAHELANLGEVHHFLKRRQTTQMFFDQGAIAAYSPGEWTFNYQGRFSLLALEGALIRLTGQCEYQVSIDQEFLPFSGKGISNQAFGEVSLKNDRPIFLLKDFTP